MKVTLLFSLTIAVFNKSVFGYLRMLTTWHCPPLLQQSGDISCLSDISKHAAAGLLLWAHAGTDRWTDTMPFEIDPALHKMRAHAPI